MTGKTYFMDMDIDGTINIYENLSWELLESFNDKQYVQML